MNPQDLLASMGHLNLKYELQVTLRLQYFRTVFPSTVLPEAPPAALSLYSVGLLNETFFDFVSLETSQNLIYDCLSWLIAS